MKLKPFRFVLYAALAVALAGCSSISSWFDKKDDVPLKGTRESVLELQKSLEPDDQALTTEGLVTPPPWSNEFWPQGGGYPNHAMQNLALGTRLKPAWSASIGEGSTKRLPLVAQPVVVDGRIFTLDRRLVLKAFEVGSGKTVWSVKTMPKGEDDVVIGGGIAYAPDKIYVTNGYNEVLAVQPADGKILWRRKISAPSRAAPTILDNRLYVTTVENKLIALDANTGATLWDYTGVSELTGLVGAASPAANHTIVVPVFTSGEITALHVENGAVAWTDNLSSVHNFGGLESLADIKAMPVMEKNLIIAISFGGRLVAIDERTGTRIWQREIGGIDTPWLAGNHVFLISLTNELIALGSQSGSIRWVTKLPRKTKEGEDLIFTGPILAGGRLIAIGSNGHVVEAAPDTGKILREWNIGERVRIPPVVAGNTLYIVTEGGQLKAYR